MERVWTSRLRWRFRGAVLAPLLAILVVGEAVVLSRLPIAGEGPDLFGGLLLAGFLNIVVVAAIAPFAGIALRRVRPDLPGFVARDRAGVVLVLLLAAGIVASGVVHHSTLTRNHRLEADALARGKAWIGARDETPVHFRRHVDLADIVAIVDGSLYRVCVPNIADANRAWCVVVDETARFPTGIRFAGAEPNRLFAAGLG
ncbi:MAG TPA: hypothetical protein VGM91_08125 [Conexibacter sp.]|jgi:hypothetical protein